MRPLSPINKFVNDTQHTLSVSKVNNNVSSSRLQPTENHLSQVKYMSSHNNVYQQQQQSNNVCYSPIKVQFCTSQVGNLNVLKSNI